MMTTLAHSHTPSIDLVGTKFSCQMGFIDYFANDMFEAWDAFGDFPELIEHLRSNYTYWQGQQRIRDAANPALLSPSPSTAVTAIPATSSAQS